MQVKVLKAFPYAPDVRTHLSLQPGDIVPIDDSVIEGLEAEGFIGEPTAEEIEAARSGAAVVMTEVVEIPDGWRDLKWFELARLAKRLGAPANVTKPVATATIEAELAARAGG